MTVRLYSLSVLWLFCLAWFAASSELPGVLLKPQISINALDMIVDQSHGILKWNNGAFLYMDVASTGQPSFHTSDREGRLISSTTLDIPGASKFWIRGFDRGTDGSIVFAGGA